ncbi:calcium-binding protein [Microvirga vignae]|uniref:calcium-binding protein n=1 Tax=Microvirga vignae TaxID=1225564 RepID=UPI000699E690|nr:calcium-binding protein [Microvirga vignae]
MTDFSIDLNNSIHTTTDSTTALQIGGDDSLFIAANGSILSDGALSTAVNVTSASTAGFTKFTVYGRIIANGACIDAEFGSANIFVGSSAFLSGQIGIIARGISVVTNCGTITTGNVTQAIWHIAGAATDSLTVINTGNIIAGLNRAAVQASIGSDTVINSGFMQGIIDLGDGNDLYDGTSGTLTGRIGLGAGNDKGYGGAGSELFYGGLGDDVIDGGGGIDTIEFSIAGATVDLRVTTQQNTGDGLDTIANVENVNGTSGKDIYNGSDGANVLTGANDDDNLFGNGGNDVLDGGLGNDVLRGGEGSDTARFSGTAAAAVDLNVAGPQETGYGTDTLDSIENLTGGSGADHFTGNAIANVLDGRLGADQMSGGAGNDIYHVDNVGDRVIETASGGTADRVYTSISYTLAAAVERLYASGSAALSLTGNTLANVIKGNAGHNRIDGGYGKDVLTGGMGNDTFVFRDRLGSTNVDQITDYNRTYDSLQLDNRYMSKLGPAGRLSSAQFVLGSAAKDADDHLIYDRAKGFLYYDPDGSGAAAKVLIAQFTNKAVLAYSEFTII